MKKFTFDAFIKANAQGLDEIRHASLDTARECWTDL